MITCAACGHENKPGRRFCAECGAALVTGCPSCGSPYDPGEKFCGVCGASLNPGMAATPRPSPAAPAPAFGAPAPAPVAERRLVSVLFADLVGFTPFASARDAEEVRETLTRYFDLATDVIGRYGGVVEKFIGDAVMAVWGTPVARENDAELSVRAALDLVDAVRTLGPGIQARAGVLTGEAAVTLGATNQGMVAGDIVNTAARLQSVAQPGTVLVGESTQRASSAAIAYEPAGAQSLKGKESPIPAFRALRVVAEVGGRNRQEGLEAPFVGRDDEMRALKDLFHATARDRRVRLVSVVGPAGIGKSRLAWEFLKYGDGLADDLWWHQGRSPSYGHGVAFWALGEMVRGRCRLRETDDERTTRARVTETVEANVPDPAERAWITPALLALLGIGDRGAAPDQLFAAWRTFFERLAQTAPVVMLFEDLHWADQGTLDFIDHILDWTRDLPILIVTLARPELLDRRTDWGAGRRLFTSLFLEPLPEPVMRELLAGLVPGLPERAVRSIVTRADGMPLYAVETVRMLLADGRLRAVDGRYEPVGDLSELAVPETLTALIASRLDALDPADRSLLQDAAVLGQSFTPAALAALANLPEPDLERRLRGLVRREILVLQADPRSPERGQYVFVQALIREVAYNTLSKRDRKAKHLAAARWFENLGSDELAGALARHYLAAWQATPEGPEADALAGQARLALKAAAERSMGLYAHEQAIGLFADALTVTTDPLERSLLLERAAAASNLAATHERTEELGRQAIAAAQEAGDLLAEARAIRRVAASLGGRERLRESADLLEAGLARIGHLRPHRDVLQLDRLLANRLVSLDDRPRALELIESVLLAAERSGDEELFLEGLQTRGGYLTEVGRIMEALALFDAVVRQAPGIGREDLYASAASERSVWSIEIDPRGSLASFRQLIDFGRRTANRVSVISNAGNAAEIAVRTGEWGWAEAAIHDVLREDLQAIQRISVLENVTNLSALRGEDPTPLIAEAEALAAGEPRMLRLLDDRLATLAMVRGQYAEAALIWRRYATWSFLNAPAALPKAGRMMLWSGDLAAARADAQALDETGVHGACTDAARVTLAAGIAALSGDASAARAGYRDARRRWQDLGLPWDEALACLDLVLLLGPDDPDAPAAAERAREVFTELGAKPFLAKLDEALAAPGRTTPAEGSVPSSR
ncbi:MAG: AAA family ATPase [Chloroflexota bacterium]